VAFHIAILQYRTIFTYLLTYSFICIDSSCALDSLQSLCTWRGTKWTANIFNNHRLRNTGSGVWMHARQQAR